jgi:hypothetical protein
MTAAQHVKLVARLRGRVATADQRAQVERDALRAAIMDARDAGATLQQIATAAGVSVAYIHKLTRPRDMPAAPRRGKRGGVHGSDFSQ